MLVLWKFISWVTLHSTCADIVFEFQRLITGPRFLEKHKRWNGILVIEGWELKNYLS